MLKKFLAPNQHHYVPPSGESTSGAAKIQAAPSKQRSSIAGVLGAKGGVGATTLAGNLAAAMSRKYGRTTLIDANFQHPDAALLLACEPRNSLLDLLGRENDLDLQMFEACCLTPVAALPEMRLLSAPLHGQAAIASSLSDLSKLVNQAQSYSPTWVIDLPRHIDKHFVTLTDACDTLVLVFEASLSCAATVRRWLAIFNELGYSDDRIVCVLNRAGGKYSAVERELDRCLGDREIMRIPNASAALWECASTGVPAVVASPRSPYTAAVQQLADRLQKRAQARKHGNE
jgi:pilus assembly protein CpaE